MGLHSRVFLISFSLFSPTSLPPSSQRTRARPYPNLFAHVHLCLGAFGKKIGKRWTEVSGRREGGEEVESAGSPDCVCVGRGTPTEALRGGQLRNPARDRRQASAPCRSQQELESTGTFGSSAGSGLPDWPGLGSRAAAGSHDAHPRGQ